MSDTAKKSLFDHINQITSVQNPKYWETLSDGDKKTWSNYMVIRFLSMKYDWIPVLSDIQKNIQELPPNILYKFLIDLLPKKKEYLKYIKGKNDDKYPKWVVELVSKYYECSINQADDYLSLLYDIKGGEAEILRILETYGSDPKEIKKLKLKV